MRTCAAVVAIGLLAGAVSFHFPRQPEARADEKKSAAKVEYKVVFSSIQSLAVQRSVVIDGKQVIIEEGPKASADEMAKQFNDLAAEGWEYVGPAGPVGKQSPQDTTTGVLSVFQREVTATNSELIEALMNRTPFRIPCFGKLLLLCCFAPPSLAQEAPKPEVVLRIDGADTDPAKIDYANLPILKGEHAVVSATDATLKFQLHDYLLHHNGKFWCMWSQGPPVEDEPSQIVRYATSSDGLKWSEPKSVVPPPKEGYAYIARGLWVYNDKLLALVAHFKGKGAFGVNKELELQALEWDPKAEAWKPLGKVFDNAINNFAPQKLPTGEWMMTRRDARFNVSVLVGGQKGFDDWQTFPVVDRLKVKGFSPDEPIWWQAGDKIVAVIRDNGGSSRLYRTTSSDNGRTWTLPAITNFPNSSSKVFSLKSSTGARVLISNANPALGRRQLHLSVSNDDGLTFTKMALLDIPMPRASTVQYPHAIEHDGHLYITFSRNKVQSEVLKVAVADIEALRGKK